MQLHATKTTTTKKKGGAPSRVRRDNSPTLNKNVQPKRCPDTVKAKQRGSGSSEARTNKCGKRLLENVRGGGNLKLSPVARKHTAPAWGRGRASKPGSRLGLPPRPVAGGRPTGRELPRENLSSSHSGCPARRCFLRVRHLSYSCQEITKTIGGCRVEQKNLVRLLT